MAHALERVVSWLRLRLLRRFGGGGRRGDFRSDVFENDGHGVQPSKLIEARSPDGMSTCAVRPAPPPAWAWPPTPREAPAEMPADAPMDAPAVRLSAALLVFRDR